MTHGPWSGAFAPLRSPRARPLRWALGPRTDAGAHDEDASLVLAARHGDADAFDELVRRHAPRLHAVARRLVGAGDAPDAVQECLMTAYQALPRFRGDARFHLDECGTSLRVQRTSSVPPGRR